MLEGIKAAGAFIALATAAGFCLQFGRTLFDYVELWLIDRVDRNG